MNFLKNLVNAIVLEAAYAERKMEASTRTEWLWNLPGLKTLTVDCYGRGFDFKIRMRRKFVANPFACKHEAAGEICLRCGKTVAP